MRCAFLTLALLLGCGSGTAPGRPGLGQAQLSPSATASHGLTTGPPDPEPVATEDRFGDPLPAGAICRLGTRRHRLNGDEEAFVVRDQGPLEAWRGTPLGWQRVNIDTSAVLGDIRRPKQTQLSFGRHVAPDGEHFLHEAADEVQWLSADGEVLWRFPKPRVAPSVETRTLVVMSDDAEQVAIARGRQVAIYGTGDGARVASFVVPEAKAGRARSNVGRNGRVSVDVAAIRHLNGGRLLAGTDEQQIWNVSTGQPEPGLKPLRSPHQVTVRLAPDGRHHVELDDRELRYVDRDGTVLHRQSISRQASALQMLGGFSPRTTLAFSKDGKRLLVRGAERLAVFALPAFQSLGVAEGWHALGFSPDGRRIGVTRGAEAFVVRVQALEKLPPHSLGHGSDIAHLSFSHDGTVLASAARDGGVVLWDAKTGAERERLEQAEGYRRIWFSPTEVFVQRRDELALRTPWASPEALAKAVRSKKPSVWMTLPSGARWALSPDVARAATVNKYSSRQNVVVIDAVHGEETWRASVSEAHTVAVDDQQAVVAARASLTLFDAGNGHRFHQVPGAFASRRLALRDKRLFVLGSDVLVYRRHPARLAEEKRIRSRERGAEALAVSADGAVLAFGRKGDVELWSVDGQSLGHLQGGHDERIRAAAFSTDGTRLATAGSEGTVVIWDVKHRRPVSTPKVALALQAHSPGATVLDGRNCYQEQSGKIHCEGLSDRIAAQLKDVRRLSRGPIAGGGCAIAGASRQVSCWGDPSSWSAPHPPKRLALRAIPGVRDAVDLMSYLGGACAVDRSGVLTCWGTRLSRWYDQPRPRFKPEVLARDVAQIELSSDSTFPSFACARHHNGTVSCWGEESWVLGTVASRRTDALFPVAGIADAIDLAVGNGFACAVTRAGQVRCWGEGDDFGLGDGRGFSSVSPRTVRGVNDAVRVAADGALVCALSGDGAVRCWGTCPRCTGATSLDEPVMLASGMDALKDEKRLCMREASTKRWHCVEKGWCHDRPDGRGGTSRVCAEPRISAWGRPGRRARLALREASSQVEQE